MFTGYSALAWAEALKDEPEGGVSIYIYLLRFYLGFVH